MNLSFVIKNENELDSIAQQILKLYKIKVFLLFGKMGVGKTTFIKSLCKSLNVIDLVSSPTFSIVNQYLNKNNDNVYHFDERDLHLYSFCRLLLINKYHN